MGCGCIFSKYRLSRQTEKSDLIPSASPEVIMFSASSLCPFIQQMTWLCPGSQEAKQAAWHPQVPRHWHLPRCPLPIWGKMGNIWGNRNKFYIPQLTYTHRHINCRSSVLKCFMTGLPKLVWKVNILIKQIMKCCSTDTHCVIPWGKPQAWTPMK